MNTTLEEDCKLIRLRVKTVCVWVRSGYDNYFTTSCNGDFESDEITPTHNGFIHCPFCGKKIEVKNGNA
jgi:DNA-directed RNA polymerase subunit RPC12/RpoP